MARAVRDDLALHVAEEAGLLPIEDETGRLRAAVSFIDLARFTALTEAMGDAAATEILERFSGLVRKCVAAHDGRIVKQIGDAFMLVFNDSRSAVLCALGLRDAAGEEPEFLGTRQGLNWGPVLYREGDYFGGTVNLAARIVAEADPDSVFVSQAFADRLAHDSELTFTAVGQRSVKHVSKPIALYEVRRSGELSPDDRTIDPVCGMYVDHDSPVARLQFEGRDFRFCSQACLQRFVGNPTHYVP